MDPVRHSNGHSNGHADQTDSSRALCKHSDGCITSALAAAGRATAIAFGIKGGLSAAILLLLGGALFRPRRWSHVFKQSFGADTASFAAFVGGVVALYKLVLCSLRRVRRVDDSLNVVVAGAASGMALALDRDQGRRTEVGLYALARALSLLWAWAVRRGYLPKLPFGDALMFGFLCMFVQHAFFYENLTMRPSYYRFLRRFGTHSTMDYEIDWFRNGAHPPPFARLTWRQFWKEVAEKL